MEKAKYMNCRTAGRLVRALVTGIALLMPAMVNAEDSSLLLTGFDSFKNGEALLAPIGRRGAGLYMSFQTSGQNIAGIFTIDNTGAVQVNTANSEVYLSVVIPW